MASALDWMGEMGEADQERGEEARMSKEREGARDERGPLKWWETFWAPLLMFVVTGMLTSGALLWRQEPLNTAEMARLTAEVATLKGEMAAVQRTQADHGADLRSNREQLHAMREALQEIKAFNAGTMREMQNLNVQFAEIRGGLEKQKGKK